MTLQMRLLLFTGLVACMGWAWAAGEQGAYIGYTYPAGGQQGTVVRVTVAGQRLAGTRDAVISGKGVHATIVGYEGAGGPLNRLQQEELKRRIMEILQQRGIDVKKEKTPPAATPATPPASSPATTPANPQAAPFAPPQAGADKPAPEVKLPDIPDLRNLEQKTVKELRQIVDRYANRQKRTKPPIAENVTMDVTIDADAAPGDRELRLLTRSGISNPLLFQVGITPEVIEPNKDENPDAPPLSPTTVPVTLNGQIMQGGVDKFPLQLQQGQKVICVAEARYLIPYLADAVPGWFQVVLALYDANGKEVAYADNCGFDPDSVLRYQVPQDGTYTLKVYDALYRGREDFVYRVIIGTEPISSTLLPFTSRGGVPLDSAHPELAAFTKSSQAYVLFTGEPLPQSDENEPNDKGVNGQVITLPRIIRGCIAKPGDVDVYKFTGRAGDDVVAEVYARRLGSPLDSLIRVIDASGRVIATNDDTPDGELGILTHQSDSYVLAHLPVNGVYYVQVSDTECHGGDTSQYFLRVSAPQPNFAVSMTPASVSVPAGGAALVIVTAFRKDGWNGDINIVLKDAPTGFKLSGACIPAGHNSASMTLLAPRGRFPEPITLQLEAQAQVAGKTIVRPVTPARQMMQAFAYQHLVPFHELLVTVSGGRFNPEISLANSERVHIPAGGEAIVKFTVRPMPNVDFHLELSDPPAGITLRSVNKTPDGVECVLAADDKHVGYAGNFIIEAATESEVKGQKQRSPIGTLPAVSFDVVKQ